MFDDGYPATFKMEAADGTSDGLDVRYRRHSLAADVTTGRLQAWHIAAARGLYRLMCDIEIAGGSPVGMGMPHLLCITDEEVRACARS